MKNTAEFIPDPILVKFISLNINNNNNNNKKKKKKKKKKKIKK
jgi:hypothetical protein